MVRECSGMGEGEVTKCKHQPPTSHRLTQLPTYVPTHLHHCGLQLCCRSVKCQSEVVPDFAALLIELAPARTGTSSSHSMCHSHGVEDLVLSLVLSAGQGTEAPETSNLQWWILLVGFSL